MRFSGALMFLWAFLDIVYLSVAQADSLSGGAGWVGAGLLGVVLGWVFLIRWPANDKLINTMLEGRDKVVANLVDAHERHVQVLVNSWMLTDKERRDGYKDSLTMILSYSQARDAQVAKESMDRNAKIDEMLSENTQAVRDFRLVIEENLRSK